MYQGKIIVPRQLSQEFSQAWEENRVILFSSFCGCAKMSLAMKLLENRKVCIKQIEKDSVLDLRVSKRDEVLVIQNLELLQDAQEIQRLCTFIRNEIGMRFVFITQGTLPAWLMPLWLEGKVRRFKEEDFMFREFEIFELAQAYEIALSKYEVKRVLEGTRGYPLGVYSFLNSLKEDGEWTPNNIARVEWEIFGYIEKTLFEKLEREEQEFVLKMAPFEKFSMELAEHFNPEAHNRKMVEKLLTETGMFIHDKNNRFEFHHVAKSFVLWKFNREYLEAEKKEIFIKGGEYFEERNILTRALECYEKANAYQRITHILEQNGHQNPGAGYFLEMEKYYLNLPREEIVKSPSLMAAMSMLMSMRANYEKSDEWYYELVTYEKSMKKTEPEYVKVKEVLIYLDIALPQKSNAGLIDTFNKLFRYIANREVKLPSFSITSRLPSVMNGGKDFSDWSKKDDLLYMTLRKQLERVLQNEGIGVVECGMCESKFEKGKDYATYLVKMMSILPQVQQLGTPEVEFAIIGTIARIHVSQGKAEGAKESLLKLRSKHVEMQEQRFLSNIDAMLAHIDLLQGEVDYAAQWRKMEAPQENTNIWTMWRYQYLVKAEVMIQESDYMSALLLLTQLLYYTQKCKRPIDEIHTQTLMAICYYRMENQLWKESMQSALSLAEEYQFVNTIAQYGMAVLPLLKTQKWDGSKEFQSLVIKGARTHATFYQRYLQQATEQKEKLSTMELAVLRLICQNKSNQEIGDILDIKLPTVKTHASNIYRKLNVKRRTEAKTEAIKRNLVEDYI